MSLPDDSIHLLSNFYNYTLSKAAYKYAVKIDADQIYFTERLKDICKAYRTDRQYKLSYAERRAWRYCCKSRHGVSMGDITMLTSKLVVFFNRRTCFELYYSGFLKTIANTKSYTSLPGINISNKDGEIGVPYKNLEKDIVFSFNGVDDHIIYEISKNSYYFPYRDFITDIPSERGTILIERFAIDKYPVLQAPFMWHHLRYYIDKGIKSTSFNQIPYSEFRTSTLKKQKKGKKLVIMSYMIRVMWFMYKYDRNYPDFRQEKEKYGL